ncbi:hypothetical protein MHU86_17308 [Fragilaria crotonensis]|nr:hypothetical protein MHU86_17308 [Fragilaria crotonensis]
MSSALEKLFVPSNNHIMKSPPLTLTASASLRATAIMLESPTPTPNSSSAPFVVEAITLYAASYQRFDADIRRAELNDEALPPFAELESHLLNIDESRGLTLPSQNQRNYNQHAHSTRQQSHHFQSRHPQTTHRVFTQRQQQAFSSILRPYSNPNGNNQNRSHPPRPPQNHSRPFRPPTNPSRPPSTTRINVAHHLLRLAHPTNPNGTIDHLSDQR